MPSPLTLHLRHTTRLTPEAIAATILDLDQWPTFTGWGPLPGIERAEFENGSTPDVVGTRVRVTTRDGASYCETITAWDIPRHIGITLDDFVPPLSRLATRFEETFDFEPNADGTHTIVRTMTLYPRNAFGRLALVPVRAMMKRALRRHMRAMEPTNSQ